MMSRSDRQLVFHDASDASDRFISLEAKGPSSGHAMQLGHGHDRFPTDFNMFKAAYNSNEHENV